MEEMYDKKLPKWKNKKNFMILSSVSVLVPLLSLSEVYFHKTFHLCARQFFFVFFFFYKEVLLDCTQKYASGVNNPAACM